MKIRLPKLFVMMSIFSAIAALSVLAQQPKKSGNDFKITEKTTMMGRSFQQTTMIKGARERTERHMSMPGMPAAFAMDMVDITQCDLKRTIQISDRARKYLITPMDSGDSSAAATPAPEPEPMARPSGATHGGVVTYAITTTDTGERKQMFGFTARHLKSTMTSESSPDACQQQQLKFERDGWYIDLNYEFNCRTERPPQVPVPGRAPRAGCQDRVRFRHSGTTNLGYPARETMTMYGPDGSATFTTTREVIELSRQPLDPGLFDIPAGYTEAKNAQEMYAAPSMADIMKMAQQQRQSEGRNEQPSAGISNQPAMPATGGQQAGAIRVGVVQINNKTSASVSTDELRDKLVGEISASGIETVPLNAISQSEAEAEAQAKQCNYVLYTDISSLKTASAKKKLGGIFGQATGIETGGGSKSEARLDFKLYRAGSSSATLESSATGKEDSSDASVGAALDREAKAVAAAARKR